MSDSNTAMAERYGSLRKRLIEQGFTSDEAFKLVSLAIANGEV